MTLAEMINDLHNSQNDLIARLTYKCEEISDAEFNATLNDHDMREKFSCIIDQTLCVDVIEYAKHDDFATVLHCYITDDCVYNLTYLENAKLKNSRLFKCVDFDDAFRRISELVRETYCSSI